jgi:hypothetical protein
MTVTAALGSMMLGAVVYPALSAALKASGRITPDTIGAIMSYDILAGMDDDEFEGGVGLDVIGDDDDDDDLLEAMTVSGAGNTDIIGAVKKAAKALVKKKVAQRVAQRNAGVVRQVGLQNRRRNPLGLVPTLIGAGVSIQVPAAPQNLFRAERLVVPSDIALDFGIADIKVGNVSQLVQATELPGAMFSEVAIDTGVSWDTAEVGNQISVTARNKSAAPIEFSAALLGTIAKR